GVFIAGAQDAYKGALQAEFQSVLESLRADQKLSIIGFDGVHVLLPWYEDGQWKLIPVNGTSFGSPNQAAMLSWAKEAAKKAGVEIEHEELQTLFQGSTMDIKDRDDTEGGKYFHVPSFLSKLNELIESKL
ncbi:MAG: hypothetical protein KDD62_14990, partial [Bdellovibrionales bacterium]|nr:hypothetical protein [Bdellovibrionales bacterium]